MIYLKIIEPARSVTGPNTLLLTIANVFQILADANLSGKEILITIQACSWFQQYINVHIPM